MRLKALAASWSSPRAAFSPQRENPAEDCLEVCDCWFRGGAAPFVEGSSALGSKSMLHRLPSTRLRRRRAVNGFAGGGLGLVAALAEGDQSIRTGGGEVGLGGVASIG